MGSIEFYKDGATHELGEVRGPAQGPFQSCRTDFKLIAFLDGVHFVQNGIHSSGDLFAVVNADAAFFVDIEPQKPLGTFSYIFAVPQGAAVCFHDGLGKLGNDLSNFHAFSFQKGCFGNAALTAIDSKEAMGYEARADSARFWLSRRFGKQRNTLCISCFSNRTPGAKDSLFSRS